MSKLASLSIYDSNFFTSPYPFYEALHQQDLIYVDEANQSYFVGKYDDVDAILKSPVFTTKPLMVRAEPVMGDRVLAQMEGEEHAAKRKLVMRGLAKDYFVNQYEPMIQQITHDLLVPFLSRGKIDLVNDFGRDYAVLVTLGILGLPTENYRDIADWHKGVAEFITHFDQTEQQKAHSLDCSKQLISLITPLVESRRQRPQNDFISMLCGNAEPALNMSTSEITALCLNILLAATEPADKTLAMMIKHLLSEPGALDEVVNDRRLIRDALEETLRLTSPVQLIPREVSEDVCISGNPIPKGAYIYCMIGAANRDPNVFPQPEKFRLERRKNAVQGDAGKKKRHLAFGGGMHMCLGAAFSLLQLEATANIIFDSLRDMRMEHPETYQETGLYTRGPERLALSFKPWPQVNHQRDTAQRLLAMEA
ncbi:cytochrome P450, cyclodipeptide synthase-associated [Salinivibrio costicola]|uniref:Cytochrome n=1 Tax=Salinivibrio costicola subsp. alcaliphilus TaxID=272773 RepID=A0ABX3KNQ3_SALCS|nr:cytochrome P450, cyclodipeptide synthase-associated [Salinivibrio costicola]OOF33305.1 cytochrome [Salinivibrio costicola subsp. alcaliphilus]